MDADKYERCASKPPYSNLAIVEVQIGELTKTMNIIREYDNPYQYITFMDSDTSKQITMEITPKLLSLPNEVVQNQIAKLGNKSPIIQAISSKYSILDHEKQYKLTKDISIETKLNILYAESLNHSRYYCEWILPPKYKPIFRANNYRNIYEKVKSELLAELDSLIAQKIELLTKNNE
uniref:Uncharacterized protein n=1 Tax=viral metagenome TaxID=1070528 RepID=A0A6C0JX06_9ZZZZ